MNKSLLIFSLLLGIISGTTSAKEKSAASEVRFYADAAIAFVSWASIGESANNVAISKNLESLEAGPEQHQKVAKLFKERQMLKNRISKKEDHIEDMKKKSETVSARYSGADEKMKQSEHKIGKTLKPLKARLKQVDNELNQLFKQLLNSGKIKFTEDIKKAKFPTRVKSIVALLALSDIALVTKWNASHPGTDAPWPHQIIFDDSRGSDKFSSNNIDNDLLDSSQTISN